MMAPYDFPQPSCPWCKSPEHVGVHFGPGGVEWICLQCRTRWWE